MPLHDTRRIVNGCDVCKLSAVLPGPRKLIVRVVVQEQGSPSSDVHKPLQQSGCTGRARYAGA